MNIEVKRMLIKEQRDELTSHLIYKKVANKIKDEHNAKILMKISNDELKHYKQLKQLTGEDIKPNKLRVNFFFFIIMVFGLTFGFKLLENAEEDAQVGYNKLSDTFPSINQIINEEEEHEQQLIGMLNEEKLNYIGSVVLGLNDALVELTGALAGYTFAFQNTKLIALTGLITGISASFSMAASEYLSTKQEEETSEAFRSAIYTGMAYVFTVVFLILPFFIISNPFISLIVTLSIAVLIILLFNYYVSVAKDYNFKKRFFEMVLISLCVSAISFVIGILVKKVFGIEV
jgi:VIT1/CCC1 family predicted Fe2+/Mn2+ transporter